MGAKLAPRIRLEELLLDIPRGVSAEEASRSMEVAHHRMATLYFLSDLGQFEE